MLLVCARQPRLEVLASLNNFNKMHSNAYNKLFCILFSYDLEFTVASDLVAVSSGTLLHQVKDKR